MPLLKRSQFSLVDPPQDLNPRELVYQVRFSKEIFRDYHDYVNRMNLYRQRLWTCKMTGKSNLTFEEALVSENRATEKVKQFPKELMAPVLRSIQFSVLPIKDLVSTITTKLQDKEDLVPKKLPFTREVLKSFIRESTYRSVPWVLHDELAREHEISTDPPKELKGEFFFKDGQIVSNRKRKQLEKERASSHKKKKDEKEDDQLKEDSFEYPIDDLLVQPSANDPDLTERPSPSRDFNVPMDCVGDLLLVWNFLSSFSKLLHLSPFSLEDFENAICHKDGTLILIVESHTVLLSLLIKDSGEYFSALDERKRKKKISLVIWMEYLCDFLEMIDISELRTCITTIKRGHYGLLDTAVKLRIFRQLVEEAIATDIFREKLDELIEQRQALAAARREEAIAEAKKKREDKEHVKLESDVADRHSVESTGSNLQIAANENHKIQNGNCGNKKNEVVSSRKNRASENSDGNHVKTFTKKQLKKQKNDARIGTGNANDQFRMESHKMKLQQGKDDGTGAMVIRNKEQRKEYFEREMEKRLVQTNPLGKDRNYSRYWWFRRDGRIFIESSDSKQWSYYSTKEELDAFMGSLNHKGVRERALHKQLEIHYSKICLELQKRSKNIAQNIELEEAMLRRSTRVRAQPRESPANAFLRYVNKLKED